MTKLIGFFMLAILAIGAAASDDNPEENSMDSTAPQISFVNFQQFGSWKMRMDFLVLAIENGNIRNGMKRSDLLEILAAKNFPFADRYILKRDKFITIYCSPIPVVPGNKDGYIHVSHTGWYLRMNFNRNDRLAEFFFANDMNGGGRRWVEEPSK